MHHEVYLCVQIIVADSSRWYDIRKCKGTSQSESITEELPSYNSLHNILCNGKNRKNTIIAKVKNDSLEMHLNAK